MQNLSWRADNQPSQRWPIYTRGNVGEVYPDVVLPLEWAIAGRQTENGWRQGAKAIGFVTDSDFDASEEMTFVGVFGGYAYFNASQMRLLGVRTPGLSVGLIDQQFLGDTDVPEYVARHGDRNLGATLRLIRSAASTMLARSVPLVEEMKMRVDASRASAPPMESDSETLWAYVLESLENHWEYLICSHVTNSMRAMIAVGQLTDLCEAKLGDPNLALVLTSGIGDVRSAGPAQAMWRLANETSDDDFDAAFNLFLEEFGHRGPNEFSIAGRDWAAYPEVALAAIETLRGSERDRSPARQQERAAQVSSEALASAKKSLGWQAKRLDFAIANAALWSRAREASKDEVIRAVQPVRHCLLELLRRAGAEGGVDDPIGPLLLERSEFEQYMKSPAALVGLIEERRIQYELLVDHEPPFAFAESQPPLDTWKLRSAKGELAKVGDVLRGAGGSPGVARGRARVLADPGDPSALKPDDVLVAQLTDPSWTPIFLSVRAVVVEIGAAMSHSMIVSRELGIPCVVGVPNATTTIPDGTEIEVDGKAGTVTILSLPS